MKNKKILLNLLLSFVMVFAIGFGFSVKANVNEAYAIDPFSVDFKSSSNGYSDYNNATITETTTYADIVNGIKNQNNLSSNDTITFYFYYKNPDTELQMIANNQFDYNIAKVLDVFNFYGAGPNNYGNYYFRYEVVIASPSNDPEPQPATTTTTVTWTQDDIVSDNLVNDDTFSKDGVTLTAELLNLEYKFIGDGTFSTTLGNFTKIEVTGINGIEGTGWSGDGMGIIWTGEPASSVSFIGGIYGDNGVTIVFTIEPAEAEPEQQQEEQSQKVITFRPVVVGQRVYENSAPSEVVVKYYVTYNDGVNSFVLIPSYDKNVFSLLDSQNNPRVAVNGIAAEAITVTGNVKGENDPEFVKIAFDSSTLYNAAHSYSADSEENVLVLTLTFSVNAPTTYGHYRGEFGLVLDDEGKTNNTSSVAYQDLSGEKLGEQVEVYITLDVDETEPENVLDIYYRQDTHIVMSKESDEYYAFGYNKEQVEIYRVGWEEDYTEQITSRIEYKFDGDDDQEVVYTWNKVVEDNNNPETYIPVGDPFTDAPKDAGTYTVTISASATDAYAAPAPQTRTVIILPAYVSIAIKDQTQTFGASIDSLGIDANNANHCSAKNNNGLFDVSGSIYGTDEITFDVIVDILTSNRRTYNNQYYYNAGTYTNGLAYTNLAVNDGNNGNNYIVNVTEGTYRVNKYQMQVWLSLDSITVQFNGGRKFTPMYIDDYKYIAEDVYHIAVYYRGVYDDDYYTQEFGQNGDSSINSTFINSLYHSSDFRTTMPDGTANDWDEVKNDFVWITSPIVPVGEYEIIPFVTFEDSNDANNFDITTYKSDYTITKFATVIKIGASGTTKTFNGGDKNAYDAPNFFMLNEDEQQFEEDVLENILSLFGDYTINYSINFTEDSNGVVQANDPESEIESYTVTLSSITFNIDGYEGNYADNFDNIILYGGWYKVNPKVVTLTADSKSSVYGQEPKPLTYTYNPNDFYNGDDLSNVTLTVKSGNTTIQLSSSTYAGIYTIVPSATVSRNYTINPVSGTYTISSASDYDFQQYFTGLVKTYNGTLQDLLEDNSPEGMIENVTATGNLQTNVNTLTNDHSYTINVTLTLSSSYANNYNNGSNTFVLEPIKGYITPAPVTVSAENKGHVYATDPQELTYTVTGTVYGNDSLNITLTPAVELTALTPYGEYTITVGASNSNYDITTVNGTYTVSKLGITANDAGHVYYETPATLSYTPSVSVSGITVVYTLKDSNNQVFELNQSLPAGTYTIVPSVPSIENSAASIDFTNGTYTVSKGQASITSITASDVYYNRALNYTVTGVSIPGIANPVEGTDYTITVTLDTTAEHGNDVLNGVRPYGTYTITATVAGTDNYTGATKSTTFHINQIDLADPTVTYTAYNTAKWAPVTTDCDGVDLVEGTVVINNLYTSSDENYYYFTLSNSYSYGTPTLYHNSYNNDNYTSSSVTLKSVVTINFVDDPDEHPKNTSTPTNMPDPIITFNGTNVPDYPMPTSEPTLPGYDFDEWDEDLDEDGHPIYVATWTIKKYTVTLKFTETSETLNTDMFTVEAEYKGTIEFSLSSAPTKAGTTGISYTYNNKVVYNNTEYTANYANAKLTVSGYSLTGEGVVFVAQYDETINSFSIKYYVKSTPTAETYTLWATDTSVAYNSTITYRSFTTEVHWFTTTPWFANEARTQEAPSTMPAAELSVYAAIVFDIGQGDVNGSKTVTSDDITLYRQWIVGGYEMTVVASGDEWATAQNYSSNTRYFLMRVADNNEDTSKDIRDVSVIRMAIVGGYNWDIETNYNVTGGEIVRSVTVTTASELQSAAMAGKKVKLSADITEESAELNIQANKSVTINLSGYTLTVKSLSITLTDNAKITIKNGTIVTDDEVTINAINANKHLNNVTMS